MSAIRYENSRSTGHGIAVQNLSKDFKDVRALSHVNLFFKENTIYGLLGRNGAGKSTLLNIINNRMLATSGSVTLDGLPAKENEVVLSRFFLANEENLYPEGMTVKNVFKWSKTFFPDFDTEYALHLCKLFELSPKQKVKRLSTGYQSIFRNITALSVNVPYVFLDEPVLGLDAYHRDLFYKVLIEKYAEKPFTAVISTHLIEEVTNVIEDVVIIKKGEIIKNESKDSLLERSFCISGPAASVDAFTKDKEVIGAESFGGSKSVYILGDTPQAGSLPDGVSVSNVDLQKLFIQLTSV